MGSVPPETFERSEERRVGKECRSRWSPDHKKKKEDIRGDCELCGKTCIKPSLPEVSLDIVHLRGGALNFFLKSLDLVGFLFFFQAEDGIRDLYVTGVQTCALPIFAPVAVGERDPLLTIAVVEHE